MIRRSAKKTSRLRLRFGEVARRPARPPDPPPEQGRAVPSAKRDLHRANRTNSAPVFTRATATHWHAQLAHDPAQRRRTRGKAPRKDGGRDAAKKLSA